MITSITQIQTLDGTKFYALVEIGGTKFGKMCDTQELANSYIESKSEYKEPTLKQVTQGAKFGCE